MSSQPVIKNFSHVDIFRIGREKAATDFRIGGYESMLDNHDTAGQNVFHQLQNQREQIARDLHDGIGSQLTHIISRLDIMAFSNKSMENQLAALRDFTSETVQQLRETIWVLNQPEITFGQLTERIKGLLSRISEDMDCPKIQVNVCSDATILLPAPLTSSIFRIVQEAVNNALKYASATTIDVNINADKYTLSLQIIDNGKGFNIDEAKRGYGLQNIQKRTDELSGILDITSSTHGTSIRAEFSFF
jgi:signal transduction histidine kinase